MKAKINQALAALYVAQAAYSVAFREIADASLALDDADAEAIRERIHSIDRLFHEVGTALRKSR